MWGNTCKNYLEKIKKLQKWALRVISGSHYRCHTGPFFTNYNFVDVFDTFSLELGTFMYKYSTDKLPDAFQDFFIKRSDVHNYQTRYSENYHKTRNKKKFSNKFIIEKRK